MNLDDAKREWQEQPQLDEPTMSESEILELVKRRATSFDRVIVRRDRREAIAAVVVAAFFAPILVWGPWLARAGVVVVLAAMVLIVARLRAAARVDGAARADRSLGALLDSERAKLDSQIRLLESVVWWYILPPAAGAMMIAIGLDGLSWFTIGYSVLVLALAIWIYRINQTAVRHDLRPRRDELDRLIAQLKA